MNKCSGCPVKCIQQLPKQLGAHFLIGSKLILICEIEQRSISAESSSVSLFTGTFMIVIIFEKALILCILILANRMFLTILLSAFSLQFIL